MFTCFAVFPRFFIYICQGEATSRDDTFELCYNYACLLIAKGDLEMAQKKLEKAEGI